MVVIHKDRELAAAEMQVDVLQPDRADEAVVSQLAHGEEVPLAAVPLLAGVLQPFLGLLDAHRHAVTGQPAHLGIVDARDEGWYVPLLERTEPDAFAL